MKRISTLLTILLFLFVNEVFSQNCTVLGCANSYGPITLDNSIAPASLGLGTGCYATGGYKQVFWEFFFSPQGGNFLQAFTPSTNGLDLDWAAYDLGTTAPTETCPFDVSALTPIVCNANGTQNIPTGPGQPGTAGGNVPTTAGHYYAIAIIFPDFQSPTDANPFTFTVGTPSYAGNVSLGCAASRGTITTNGSLSLQSGSLGTCTGPGGVGAGPYRQVFWQYFLSTGGDFTQTFTPTTPADLLDLDWVAFDIGSTLPSNSPFFCPTGNTWTQVACDVNGGSGLPTGPGFGANPAVTTTSGHYYAIGVFYYQAITTGFTIGTPQLGGVDLTNAANCFATVLPVNLSLFDARANSCSVDLSWTAETETNFSDYEVQYSTNGSSFQTIGTVAASKSRNYSYEHANPAQGKIYYRLKMVDLDGSFEYSKVIALNLNCNRAEVVVYPNPVTDKVNINITNAQSETIAHLFDNTGKLVFTGTMTNGTNSINMSKFTSGMYLLVLKNNFETQNLKIIKQ
jgi:hypothetical protein